MWEKLHGLLPRGELARATTVLVGGTGVGQLLLILSSPVLTRIYTPEDFGVLAMYSALLAAFGVLASLRYERAIPLPAEDKDAWSLLVLSVAIVPIIAILSGLMVLLSFGEYLTAAFNAPLASRYLWLLPIGVVLQGLYQPLNYWAIRMKAFGKIANTRLTQSVSSILVQVSLGLFGGPLGLILGQIAGQGAGIGNLFPLVIRGKKVGSLDVSRSRLMRVAIRYRRFPQFATWSGLITVLGNQLPAVLLLFYFGPITTGLYALGSRILQTPMILVGVAVSHVFYSSAAEAVRTGRISTLAESAFVRLVQLALPIMAIAALAGPEAFGLVFGAQWREAGIFMQLLAPWLFVEFISSPLANLAAIMDKQRQESLFRTVLLVSRLCALILGGFLDSAIIAIAFYGIASAICWFAFMIWNMALSGNNASSVLRHLLQASISSLPLLLPTAIMKLFAAGQHADLMVIGGALVSAIWVALRYLRSRRKDATV